MRQEKYSPKFFLGARHVLSSPVLIFARESISADMAKGNQLHRLVMIVNRLAHPGRYMMPERLTEYVEYQMRSRYSDNAGISLRTLQRDFHTIEELFGIKIRYRKDYGYYIAEYIQESRGIRTT